MFIYEFTYGLCINNAIFIHFIHSVGSKSGIIPRFVFLTIQGTIKITYYKYYFGNLSKMHNELATPTYIDLLKTL